MNKRHLALAAGIVVALIVLAVVGTTVGSAPAITVRCSKVAPFADGVGITMEMKNQTTRTFTVLPGRLERLQGGTWRECAYSLGSFSATGDLQPHGSAKCFCLIKPWPTGTRLRLVLGRRTLRGGLGSFAVRVQIRLSGLNNRVSLNPFDKTLFYTDPAEVVTEEFVAP